MGSHTCHKIVIWFRGGEDDAASREFVKHRSGPRSLGPDTVIETPLTPGQPSHVNQTTQPRSRRWSWFRHRPWAMTSTSGQPSHIDPANGNGMQRNQTNLIDNGATIPHRSHQRHTNPWPWRIGVTHIISTITPSRQPLLDDLVSTTPSRWSQRSHLNNLVSHAISDGAVSAIASRTPSHLDNSTTSAASCYRPMWTHLSTLTSRGCSLHRKHPTQMLGELGSYLATDVSRFC